MQMKTILAFSWILILGLGLTGCSLISKATLEQPKVAFHSVHLKDPNAEGATLVFGVEVDNPNSVPLKVDALKYELELAGKHLSTGRLDKAAEVPAKDKAVVEIPVPVKYTDVFSSLMGFLGSNGKTEYRIKGDATFGLFTIPFNHTGELKLKK